MEVSELRFLRPATLQPEQLALVWLALNGKIPVVEGVAYIPHSRTADHAATMALLAAACEPEAPKKAKAK